jgi:hypothetical protein
MEEAKYLHGEANSFVGNREHLMPTLKMNFKIIRLPVLKIFKGNIAL